MQHYHGTIDVAKQWSRETAADLLVEAALEEDEETAAEIHKVVELVRTVTDRIEQGDNTRARQPGKDL
ncbi:hypothetical protein HSR121_2014 [Halapricum desulfuricans]|uniref:Uncharacterized protein n=2 Tax=Halapricum desulfuricans TaxID=2841257 RepID=A0A897N0X1_9EURY|nr:hypothetical protein HSR121_2014 [Halapricum desulfuricans]